MVFKWITALSCLTVLLGAGIAQEKARSPDEHVQDLMARYGALSEKDKIGPKGESLIEQLKAVPGKLPLPLREAIARFETAHNLRKIALALKQHDDKKGKWQRLNPQWFTPLLPYLEQKTARPRWEYKVLSEADIRRLAKDDLTAGLNALGQDGWELVGFEKTRFILKRQRSVPLGGDW
jgi:hypothetical protein